MATMASHVAARLIQDTEIVSYTSDRVYAYDIRADGPDAHPEVYGPYGFTQPTICVDDAGGIAPPFAPSGTYVDRLTIWIFAENSATGRTAMDQLAARIWIRLHRWQEANTKALLLYADRTGFVADPSPFTGAMEQLTFRAAGTLAGVST